MSKASKEKRIIATTLYSLWEKDYLVVASADRKAQVEGLRNAARILNDEADRIEKKFGL